MSHKRFILICAMLLLLVSAPTYAQDNMDMPAQIDIQQQGVMPEGIEWDEERERFLISSVTTGTIFAVTDDGQLTPFIEDDDLVSTFGIHIDKARDRLLVANSNAAILSGVVDGAISQLGAYDLESGERLFLADLGSLVDTPAVMANDVTVDAAGNAYVTDSFANAIFKVTPEGEASVLLQDSSFAVENNIGLNGVDYHSDGYLLTAVPFQLALYKVPLTAPDEFAPVELQPPFAGDGIVLNDDRLNAVAFFANPDSEVFIGAIEVTSDDDWASATITHHTPINCAGTTLAMRGEIPYYVTAYLRIPDQQTYQIAQAELQAFNGEAARLFSSDLCRTL